MPMGWLRLVGSLKWCLFRRISSLLQSSFAKETYDFKEPTNRSHPIGCLELQDKPTRRIQRTCRVVKKHVWCPFILLQCVAVRCSVLQCGAVSYNSLRFTFLSMSRSSLRNVCRSACRADSLYHYKVYEYRWCVCIEYVHIWMWRGFNMGWLR